jgi:hypothetical protein
VKSEVRDVFDWHHFGGISSRDFESLEKKLMNQRHYLMTIPNLEPFIATTRIGLYDPRGWFDSQGNPHPTMDGRWKYEEIVNDRDAQGLKIESAQSDTKSKV